MAEVKLTDGPEQAIFTESTISPDIAMNLDNAIEIRSKRLQTYYSEGEPDGERRNNFLAAFHYLALSERFRRAANIESEEIQFADAAALSFLKFLPYRLDCIDGRNKLISMFGITPGVGGDFRVPAGDPQGLSLIDSETLELDPKSDYADSLRGVTCTNNDQRKVIILDSHLHCAAQAAREGSRPPSSACPVYSDEGLLADVKYKKQMHSAITRFTDQENPDADIDTIQISYDPKTNYLFMGLEKNKNIQFGEANGGYSSGNIATMVESGSIISTEQLAHDIEIKSLLEEFIFTPDWIENYRGTGKQFWENIQGLASDSILDNIQDKVRSVYPEAENSEIETRSKLLLLNLYSGFLNNTAGIVTEDHHETTIIISKKDYGPHRRYVSGFQVSSYSSDIPGNVILGNSIVMKNRAQGLVTDVTGNYKADELLFAPYTAMVQTIVRRDGQTDWKELSKIDFSDLNNIDWLHIDDNGFKNYVIGKYSGITVYALDQLNELRSNAIKLMNNANTREQIQNGTLHVLYTVTDSSRRPVFVFPLDFPHVEG